MAATTDLSNLWWPKFEGLYAELVSLMTDVALRDADDVVSLLRRQSSWLQKGLEGFKPPADQSRALLQKGGQLALDDGKKFPIKTDFFPAAWALSKHLVTLRLLPYGFSVGLLLIKTVVQFVLYRI